MYKPESTILNHNPWLPFPVAFYFGSDTITVRTFAPARGRVAKSIGAAESRDILRSHLAPFEGPHDGARLPVFDAAALGAPAGSRYRLRDALTVKRDPRYLGLGVVSDRCDLIWLVTRAGFLDFPVNRTVRHLPDRRIRAAIYGTERKLNLLTVASEFADTRWEDSLVVIKGNPAQGFRIEFEDEPAPVPQLRPFYTPEGYPRFGGLVLEGPVEIAAGGAAQLTVRAVREDGSPNETCGSEVRIEMVSGYAPHTRVRLVGGVARVKVMALGLDAGESMRVKAGWRYFPGLAETTLRVGPAR